MKKELNYPPGLFITGTDTGVGKTLVTAALLSKLCGEGVDAVPMKPVQTGCPWRADGGLAHLDLELCFRLTGREMPAGEEDLLAPYRFKPACSPHLAAEQEGVSIDMAKLEQAALTLKNNHEAVLVEGAGGVLVPVDDDKTMLDLMGALGFPVVVASRPTLGTINHTLLTLHELRRAGLEVYGVVFCETEPVTWNAIERDNWRTIERLGETRILGHIPYLPGLASGDLTPATFATTISESLQSIFCKTKE